MEPKVFGRGYNQQTLGCGTIYSDTVFKNKDDMMPAVQNSREKKYGCAENDSEQSIGLSIWGIFTDYVCFN